MMTLMKTLLALFCLNLAVSAHRLEQNSTDKYNFNSTI